MKFYSAPFRYLTPVFIAGILSGNFIGFPADYLLLGCILFMAIGLWYKSTYRKVYLAVVLAAFFLLGVVGMQNFKKDRVDVLSRNATVIVEMTEVAKTDKPWKKCMGHVTHLKTDNGTIAVSQDVLFYCNHQLVAGDVLLLNTDFITIKNAGNPGEFDSKAYWNNKNIYKMAFIGREDYRLIDHSSPGILTAFFSGIRESLSGTLDETFKGDNAAVAKALLLGDKSQLSMETRNSFSNAGAMHVLAVSGLHVGIIMFLLLFVLGRFSRFISKRSALVICLVFVWCYAGVTGFSPSVMRAAFMFSLLIGGQQLSRQTDSTNILFFSAFVLLLFNPLLIYDIGFQLSYLAVLGILLTHKTVVRLFDVRNKWLKKLWEGTAVGISAQVFTAPLMLYQFHQFPNYFMISNIGVMIFAGALLAMGMFLFLIKGIGFLKLMIGATLGIGFTALLVFIQFIESLPWAVAKGFSPSFIWIIAIYFLIAMVFVFRKKKKWMYAFSFVFVILLGLLQWGRYDGMRTNEIVVYNTRFPAISVKINDKIVCFYKGKKDDRKKLDYLMRGYSGVRSGTVSFRQLQEGTTFLKVNNKERLKFDVNEGGIRMIHGEDSYFIRTGYDYADDKDRETVIDLPYLARNNKHYHLSDGAMVLKL